MVQVYSEQQTVRSLLQPGEELLWWDRPNRVKIKPFLTMRNVRMATISALLQTFTIFFFTILKGTWTASYSTVLSLSIGGFCIFFALNLCQSLAMQRTSLQYTGRYRKWTMYAVTNMRAMIIVLRPGGELYLVEYYAHEIGEPASYMDANGSGSLAFGPRRKLKAGRYRFPLNFKGSFEGIAHVQEVAALLKRLRSGYKMQVECKNVENYIASTYSEYL